MITQEINIDEITPLLDRLQASLSNMQPVMQDLGELMIKQTKDRFVAGTAPGGTPWAPKSPATMRAYKRRGDRQDPRPLFGPSGRLSSEIFYQAGPSSVEWGSNLIYSGVMQFGAAKGAFGTYQGQGFGGTTPTISIPWGNIPARPFIGLSDDDRAGITDVLEEWLLSVAGGQD